MRMRASDACSRASGARFRPDEPPSPPRPVAIRGRGPRLKFAGGKVSGRESSLAGGAAGGDAESRVNESAPPRALSFSLFPFRSAK